MPNSILHNMEQHDSVPLKREQDPWTNKFNWFLFKTECFYLLCHFFIQCYVVVIGNTNDGQKNYVRSKDWLKCCDKKYCISYPTIVMHSGWEVVLTVNGKVHKQRKQTLNQTTAHNLFFSCLCEHQPWSSPGPFFLWQNPKESRVFPLSFFK